MREKLLATIENIEKCLAGLAITEDSAALSPGCEKKVDPRHLYINHSTKKTQWNASRVYGSVCQYQVVLDRASVATSVGRDGLSGVGISFAVFPDGQTEKDVVVNMTPGGPAATNGNIAAHDELFMVKNIIVTL